MADFRLNRRLNNRGRTQQAVQDAIRWRRRRALLDDTGVSYAYSTDLALWYNWATAPDGNLSLAAQTNRNDDSSFGPTLSLTRATTASVTDYNNIIKTVASGEERYTGGRRVENLMLQSSDLDNATWDPQRLTVTAGQADPFGGTDAANCVPNTDNNSHFFYDVVQAFDATIGKNYVYSFYAKANGYNFVAIMFDNANEETWFNLSTGTLGTHNDSAVTSLGYGIEDVGSGWYRCWAHGGNDVTTLPLIMVAAADATETFIGDGSSGAIIYGPQLEDVSGQDDPAPSEYQATTTAAVSKWYATKRRTNLAGGAIGGDSEDLTSWTTYSAPTSVTLDAVDFPSVATKSTEIVSSSTFDGVQYLAALTPGHTYTASIYAKGVDGTETFEINDGAASQGTHTATTAWARYETTWTVALDATGTGVNWAILLNAASKTVNFAGAQLEDVGAQSDQSASAYIPCLDNAARNVISSSFDTDITPTGLLVEEARTNICLQSEDFSTTWTVGANTLAVVGDEAIAPDGTLTADLIVDDSGTGSGAVWTQQTVTVATSTAYAFSFFAKADQLSRAYILLSNFTTPSGFPVAHFDLSAGTVGTVDAGFDDSGIEDAGNGWYRCWATFTTDVADTAGNARIGVAQADANENVDLDGTSSIFVWGAQLEAGAFPTSYIPTVAASVTRNLDVLTTTDVTWSNANEGSFYTKFVVDYAQSNNAPLWEISDSSTSDRIFPSVMSDLAVDVNILTGTGDDDTLRGDASDITLGTAAEFTLGYALNDTAYYLDGTLEDTSALVTFPQTAAWSRFEVAGDFNARDFNGHIAEIAYYNTRRIDATLDDMSTNGIGEGAEE